MSWRSVLAQHSAGVVVAALFHLMVPAVGVAEALQGAWLDSEPKQWNKAGASLPHAPVQDRSRIPSICKSSRPTGNSEERAVASAGWMVFKSVRNGRGITIVSASGTLDGMCRPDAYQNFVFLNGRFAGTISPGLMGARADGASVSIAFPRSRKIVVQFVRYRDSDPRCCPSRMSEGVFDVINQGGRPVLVFISAKSKTPS